MFTHEMIKSFNQLEMDVYNYIIFSFPTVNAEHIANRGVNINTVLYNFLGLVFAIIRVRKHWWDDIPKSSVMDCVLAESYVK
jgi:hypothetical protein